MSFQPVLPMSGLSGWRFLQRSLDTQKTAFETSASMQREAKYVAETLPNITTAEELVADRRVLQVALGAFGLESDINNKFFIQRVLGDGTAGAAALSNRLADKRYFAMSQAFALDSPTISSVSSPTFVESLISSFTDRQFEIAVGEQDTTMRLALALQRDLPKLAGGAASDRAKWFTVLGTPPLRQVFEGAFGLSTSFGALDVDKQLEILQHRAEAAFGDQSLEQFTDPEKLDALTQKYFLRTQLEATLSGYSSQSSALQLLQSGQASLVSILSAR
jgi:hypothetical protein